MQEVVQDEEGFYTVNVPIRIPAPAYLAGGIELFATAYGWTPDVKDLDNNGAQKTNEAGDLLFMPNPISSLDKAIEVVQNFVAEIFKGELLKKAQIQAKLQAQIQAQELLGEIE